MGFLLKVVHSVKPMHISDTGIKNGTHDFSSPHSNPYSIESAHLNDARRSLAKMQPYRSEATKKHIATYKAPVRKNNFPWPSHGGPR